MNKGKIVQIIGPVVDIEFADKLPAIYNALFVEFTPPGATAAVKLPLEVQQHLEGDNWVRAVAMSTTEGLKRGMEITDTGAPISMPFGEAVMGRVFDVTAHNRALMLIDDLGAGALVGLEQFGLPHEPTVRESIEAGADVVLFSGDKLIGASQAGILVGRKDLIGRLRKHPLMRAMRVDKTCLLVLERTLHLFRDPDLLRREHPLYRMICTPVEVLSARAKALVDAVARAAPKAALKAQAGVAYLGSGSLPTEVISSVVVSVSVPSLSAAELARRLRLDEACVFSRIEDAVVLLDMRTLTDDQVPAVAAALGRAVQ